MPLELLVTRGYVLAIVRLREIFLARSAKRRCLFDENVAIRTVFNEAEKNADGFQHMNGGISVGADVRTQLIEIFGGNGPEGDRVSDDPEPLLLVESIRTRQLSAASAPRALECQSIQLIR